MKKIEMTLAILGIVSALLTITKSIIVLTKK